MALDSSKTVDKKPLPLETNLFLSVPCVSAATRHRGVTRSRVKSAEVRVSSSKRRRRGLPKIGFIWSFRVWGIGSQTPAVQVVSVNRWKKSHSLHKTGERTAQPTAEQGATRK